MSSWSAAACALLLLALIMGAPVAAPVWAGEWAGSDQCHACHRDRYASWHRTFHRTMTQEATPQTVQGRFDGTSHTHWGMTVRPVRRGDTYWFEYFRPGESQPVARYQVFRTVGSNRYQQYLTREANGGTYFRLHMLWHNEDARWVHMNAAFLGPDDQGFDDNVAVWNHNCIFCHNTGPQPGVVNYDELLARQAAGEPVDAANEARYESTVSELGIACEACHGPGAEHVAKQQRWWTRLSHTLSGRPDGSIVHPARLDRDASTQVCGQCHGQRIPRSSEILQHFINHGPIYRAGDDLFESVELVWPETRLPLAGHAGEPFRLRFWKDRTPRLTAYEYQGLKLSACHTEAELTCISCHTMHSGDRHGMLPEADRAESTCLGCHQDIAGDIVAHTHHPPDSPGSSCYGCHMPEIVYGVMDIHRSHRIEVPKPAEHAAAGRPNACNLCHLDQSVAWAESETARLWGLPAGEVHRADGLPAELPDGIARLYAGDPVERAVTAVAIGRALERGQQSRADIWQPHLINALSDDYPAVRRFAAASLAVIGDELGQTVSQDYDFIASPEARVAALDELIRRFSRLERYHPAPADLLLNPDWTPAAEVAELRRIGRERSEAINIGE